MNALGLVAVVLGLCVGGCANGVVPGARDIEPPTTGVYVGGLYKPLGTSLSRSGPVNLGRICVVSRTLAEFGVSPPQGETVSDIDLLRTRKLSAAVAQLNTAIGQAGLSGDISSYYEYKIVNATSYDIDLTSAAVVFEKLMKQPGCRQEVAKQAADGKVYQVTKAYVGDIVFRRKTGGNLSGTLSPAAVQAALAADTDLRFSGKGLVFAFVAEKRTAAGY
ncbi:hypothetical protein FHS55_002507 [Angulomicrobium tetraedrale]|uniref:Uncharacterized protein n=1 Tax=Ancylobacter tetraedralis TaxID=217068 RepID=A0A839ZB36_9HYPH|nr:hypothetical protein [Ancylobacter tetraedralis]MBB3771898.1 hypothetical protein [Ancylobacter tetraedralis]